ncbi:universal stress protein [Halolamina sediminis]|jgi:nucleotide-binding universal stress UspA family protein|uniref:universal stress protein n=1 Tax=Halolamina sediminis TaxID=1480675 RepID=UPI0006B51465|nr:universal stress protein [Halolamina sediminis]
MTFLVPFDGSTLAAAALDRAVQFADTFDQPVIAAAVVPQGNTEYARDRGWMEAGEPFDHEAIVARLREQVREHAPEATFRVERASRRAPAGSIARKLRQVARKVDASMVFIGSDNAGRLVTTLSSVGGNVAADLTYDVVIVRHAKQVAVGGAPDLRVTE